VNWPLLPLFSAITHMEEVWVAAKDDFRLDEQTRALLERWVRSASSQQRAVRRSRIILALDEGLSVTAVSAREGIGRRTVAVWKARFMTEGPNALLKDRPGRGRPKGRRADVVASILRATATPPPGTSRWTSRALARHLGVSHSTVLRVWRDAGISEGGGRYN
jgi:transposase